MDDIFNCPVCDHSLGQFLVELRSSVPTLQNTTLSTVHDALNYPMGSLRMLRCPECSFVWNEKFRTELISYDANYDNDVSTSDYYMQHLEAMVDRVLASVPPNQPISYVEVGCGEGDFLNLVFQKSAGRCVSAIGFDPSFTGEDKLQSGVVVHKSFFGRNELALIPPDANVICSRHTIEHVPNVRDFTASLAAAVGSPNCRLLVETPNVDWILRHGAFQDFFYEHCSLFTPHSMTRLLAEQGLMTQVTSVYDGQYMWAEATRASQKLASLSHLVLGSDSLDLANKYVARRSDLISHWSSFVRNRRSHGVVAIWGGASKGVTFALLLATEGDCELDCAIDLNTSKQGRFLPTTGLPVVSPSDAKHRGVQTVVIMNPNYEGEIRELAGQLDWYPEFVTLNEPMSETVR